MNYLINIISENMDMKLSRLTSWKDLNPFLEDKVKSDFFSFLDSVYKILMELNPGDKIHIQHISPTNRDRFIKVSCLFILENHPDYLFSDDYSSISRLRNNPTHEITAYFENVANKKKFKDELETTQTTDTKKAQRRKDGIGYSTRIKCD